MTGSRAFAVVGAYFLCCQLVVVHTGDHYTPLGITHPIAASHDAQLSSIPQCCQKPTSHLVVRFLSFEALQLVAEPSSTIPQHE